MLKAVAAGFSAILVLLEFGCNRDSVQLFEENRILMDTLVSMTIYAIEEPAGWRDHIAEAFDEMQRIEDLSTSFHDSSEIGQLNLNGFVLVSHEVSEIIDQAQKVAELTDGAFDVSILPVFRLWDFKSENPTIPSADEIQTKLKLVDYKKIIWDGNDLGLILSLPEKGMGLDLGGIAKGYAVDRAVAVLSNYGYEDFMVEAGGDLRTVAGKLTQGQRRIWVRHPRKPDEFFASIRMDEGAVATSGDYERFFEVDGKRYHHILDPKTGLPSSPCVSVTILAPDAALADALSTAVFVLGPDFGMDLIERTPDVEGLIIYLQDADRVSELSFKASKKIEGKLEIITD